jgi:hypothetical protein
MYCYLGAQIYSRNQETLEMAVSSFTVKVNGTVSYFDNSHGSFEATAIFGTNLGGIVAQHSQIDSQFHFAQLFADKADEVNATLALLPGGSGQGDVTLTPTATPPDRVVDSFIMEISGLVSEDDNTTSSFVAQFIDGTVDLFPNESVAAWRSLNDGTAPGAVSLLTLTFEALAGTGNATVS